MSEPLLIGTKIKLRLLDYYYEVAAVLYTGGERYYHLTDQTGTVSMFPASLVEQAHTIIPPQPK